MNKKTCIVPYKPQWLIVFERTDLHDTEFNNWWILSGIDLENTVLIPSLLRLKQQDFKIIFSEFIQNGVKQSSYGDMCTSQTNLCKSFRRYVASWFIQNYLNYKYEISDDDFQIAYTAS